MNQIPNIEEEENKIREGIEERVEDFITRFSVNIADVKTTKELAKYWIRKTLLDLQETLHQQLQKARQDWLREEIVRLEVEQEKYSMSGSAEYDLVTWQALQTIIDRYHSELDQDKQ